MAHKTQVFCADRRCGDRLQPTVHLTARIAGPLRADWQENWEDAHTTRRVKKGFRPDVKMVAVRKVKLRWNARSRRKFQPV